MAKLQEEYDKIKSDFDLNKKALDDMNWEHD